MSVDAKPRSEIVTLLEGSYFYGLASLVNSLVLNDFSGTILAGYRGSLPFWLSEKNDNNDGTIFVSDDVRLKLTPVTTEMHLTNYKPNFISQVMEVSGEDALIFYFDPDITIKAPWSFFVEWASAGVALVEDVNGYIPNSHPRRATWGEAFPDLPFNDSMGHSYVNAGFIGLKRENLNLLTSWKNVLARMERFTGGRDKWYEHSLQRPSSAFSSFDQDALNIALMCSPDPKSIVGREGMDFAPGGYVMSHAIGRIKPWQRNFATDALRGRRPSLADTNFFKHLSGPLRPYTANELRRGRANLTLGKALARIFS